MKDYFLVLKVLLKNNFRAGKNKYVDYGDEKAKRKRKAAKTANVVMFSLGIAVILAAVYVIVHVMAMMTAMEGLGTYFLSSMLTAGQIIIVVFGMSSVLSNLFFSKDNEFLASLPVKPATVFAVKMTVIYINEFLMSAVLLLSIIAAFISGSVIGGVSLPIYFYFLIPVIFILEPIVPLAIVSILSFPLIKVVGFFKNRSAATLVFSVLSFVLFMVLYMALVPNLEKFFTIEGQSTLLTPQIRSLIYGTGRYVFYNKAFAFALTGNKFWINMLIVLATVAGATGLTVGLAALLYGKAAGKSGEETRKSAAVTVGRDVESRGKALFKREWKTLIRNQSFAFNSIMGSVITPVIIVIMHYIGISGVTEGAAMSSFAQNFSETGFVLFYCIMLMCGINYTASLAFSREGNTFYVLRYLPVQLNEIIRAKINLACAVSFVGLALTAIVSLIFLKMEFLNWLPLVAAVAVYQYGFNVWCVYRDLKKPNVNWTTPYEVIKKNFYPMVPMFLGMFIGIVCLFATQIIAKYENAVSLKITVPVFWTVVIAGGAVIITVASVLMKKRSREYFDRIAFDS